MSTVGNAGVSKPKSEDVVVVGSVRNGSIIISNSRNRQKSKVVLERENQMKALKQQFPRVDSMTIHDILSKVKFDVGLAQKELKKVNQRKTSSISLNTMTTNPKPPEVMVSTNSEVEDDPLAIDNKSSDITATAGDVNTNVDVKVKTEQIEEEAIFIKEEPVDEFLDLSDLSENDKRVFFFFQNGELEELKFLNSNPDHGQSLAQSVASLRPFMSWSDLAAKLRKRFVVDLINIAHEMFDVQDKIRELLVKGKDIAHHIEMALQRPPLVTGQPRLLPLTARLKKYQVKILNWLMVMHSEGVHGILNYTKGSERMIQLISFLALLKERGQVTKDLPHLVIVPSNIIDNWIEAFKSYCPSLKVFVYHGTKEERASHRLKYYKGDLYKFEVILTTYTVVVHIADEREVFRSMTTDYIIFDETDAAKNINIQLYDNLIKTKALRKLLITGGTLQGNPLELISVLFFVIPTKLLDNCNLPESSLQKALRGNLVEGEFTEFEKSIIEEVKVILQPFILENLKEDDSEDVPIEIDISEEPTIIIKEEKVDMDPETTNFIEPETTNFINFSADEDKDKFKISANSFEGVPHKEAMNQLSSFPRISLKKLSDHEISKYQGSKKDVDEDWDERMAEASDSSSDSDYVPLARESSRKRTVRGRGTTSKRGGGRGRKRKTEAEILLAESSEDSIHHSSVGKRTKKHKNCSCCVDDSNDALSALNDEIEKCLEETGTGPSEQIPQPAAVFVQSDMDGSMVQEGDMPFDPSQIQSTIFIKKESDVLEGAQGISEENSVESVQFAGSVSNEPSAPQTASVNFGILPNIVKTEIEMGYDEEEETEVPVIKAEIADAEEDEAY